MTQSIFKSMLIYARFSVQVLLASHLILYPVVIVTEVGFALYHHLNEPGRRSPPARREPERRLRPRGEHAPLKFAGASEGKGMKFENI